MDPILTNADEFRTMFRMTRTSFVELYHKLKDHQIFKIDGAGRPQFDIILQLMILLNYFSLNGNGQNFTSIGKMFHVSKGACRDCFNRVLSAVLSLKEEFIVWPDDSGRKEISNRFLVTYGLPDCVGCIDGTLINLVQKPEWMGHDFYTRKCGYAVNALIVCDDDSRINYVYSGWVGSVHDNRVWRNCKMKNNPQNFFSASEYLIGDSAFSPERNIVPSYKAMAGIPVPPPKEFFNFKLNQGRTKIEHTIGLLKSRFPCLRCLNLKIKEKSDIGKVVNIVLACVVLHNFLLREPVVEQEYYDIITEELMDEPELYAQRYAMDEVGDPESRRSEVFRFVLSAFNYVG